MPVVFVHGVSNRPGSEYEAGVEARKALIRRFLAPALGREPEALDVISPLWGDLGATSRWNYPWLPNSGVASLGPEPSESEAVLAEVGAVETHVAGAPVLAVARTEGLVRAVDLMVEWNLISKPDPAPGDALVLAETAYRAAHYAQQNPQPSWLAEVATDAELIARLRTETEEAAGQEEHAALGIGEWWDQLRESADRLGNLPDRAVGVAGVSLLRKFIHRNAAMFAGDLLVYLARRGTREQPGGIVKRVIEGLEEGARKTAPDDPLIVLAHSLGGVLTYDVLTYYAPEIRPKALVTVGSQVAVFEDLKIFNASDETIGPGGRNERAPKPAGVGCWINIFDRADALSFDAADVFNEVQDYDYSSGLGADRAHGGYFVRPSFYLRLGERLTTLCP